jgi:transposase InsO family protein
MKKDLVINALRMAIWRLRPSPSLISHSDRGNQHCCNDFQKFLKKYMTISGMSPVIEDSEREIVGTTV